MGFVARKGAGVEEAAISIARAKQEHTVEYPSKQKNGDRPLFRLVTRVAVPCDGKPSQGATHHLTVFGFRMIPLWANRLGCAMALRYIATVKQKNGDRSSPPRGKHPSPFTKVLSVFERKECSLQRESALRQPPNTRHDATDAKRRAIRPFGFPPLLSSDAPLFP